MRRNVILEFESTSQETDRVYFVLVTYWIPTRLIEREFVVVADFPDNLVSPFFPLGSEVIVVYIELFHGIVGVTIGE